MRSSLAFTFAFLLAPRANADAAMPAPATVDDPGRVTRCLERMGRRSAERVVACIEAERAARELETMRVFAGPTVGFLARPGNSYLALQRILALGEMATPILLRLAGSAAPVARMAAVWGFGENRSAAGRRALLRLRDDHTVVPVMAGCTGFAQSIGEAAAIVLKRYSR